MTHPAAPSPQHSSLLNAQRRSSELHELASGEREVDMLVIGGGVTGAGVALDAASRGFSVVLAEAHDLAFGTSRWSSKLVHGGLRYLASGDVAVARESARERHLLMTKIAPHLSHALPQLLPHLPGVTPTQRALTRVGFMLGDGLRRWAGTPSTLLPGPKRVTAAEALRLAPALRQEGLRGGVVSADGQLEDDAKLVTAIARTAASYGAHILTGMSASDATGAGALLTDQQSGESFRLRARSVVNATGVWAAEIDPDIQLRPSRGTHLVVSAESLGNPSAALTVPHPGSVSRFVFALPQRLGRVFIGLTDEDAPGPVPDVPTASETEIDFLLSTVSTVLERPLGRADVLGTFAGLRPLISTGASESTADISRRHHVAVSSRGVVNVLGGKLTTYRAMAEDAVDLACRTAGLSDPGCVTTQIALVGAPGSSLPPAEERALLAKACTRPEEQIAPGIAVTRAEIAYAVRAEGALTAADVLDRRTRIGLVAADREAAFAEASELVAESLR
ncbi:glycerol-3-phosphate dehydrogenase/oxidase [Leucobacter sp. UT-8R-CII-1-4]|uniref:glycerol-3-phosphate dehydrogenase/oxidase n=1 Tax=Leucobacter sp. UT-8R-CII-1-4 TaxID=3040075 RepID=UPI0024A8D06A|nr:glycerol-3-phosphate dehydrogenase/oxidase [Leucobacter sp. UT-8R-CII-1-4]MDI6022986.1 glycerol-3-phosphate dehydrogenase/oxidase [Leucobacter sp. UT-8R-CII-1-4]